MSPHRGRLWALLLGLSLVTAAHAATPPAAQLEIDYLLAQVAQSECQFYRNGTWYSGKQAETHLKLKYQYLSRMDSISSTEDFIEKAASQSSTSGHPYLIRCAGGASVESRQWFEQLLMVHRIQSNAAPSPP